MATQLSPSIITNEFDLATVVPAVATATGAIGGVFRWGPVGERVLIDSENSLVSKFGQPTSFNGETFFAAASFLAYTNGLIVSRAANTVGATPFVSFASTTGNNVFSGNTTGLAVGQYVTQTGNSAVVGSGNLVSITSVNSSAIILSQNANASNGAFSLYFGNPETTYSAVAFDSTSANAFVANLVNQIVSNTTSYTYKDGTFSSPVSYVARYPGALGNSLRIAVCDVASSFSANIASAANINFTVGSNSATVEFLNSGNTLAGTLSNLITIGDQVLAGNSAIGYQYLSVTGLNVFAGNATYSNTILTVSTQDPYRLHTPFTSNTVNRYWEFRGSTGIAPGQSQFVKSSGNTAAQDELHVVVIDNGGLFTGIPGTILEVYKGLSRAVDSLNIDGSTNYYKNVINNSSKYVWWTNDRTTALSANSRLISTATSVAPANMTFVLGADGYDETGVSLSTLGAAYDLFASPDDVDISLVLQGRPSGSLGLTYQLANYIIDNIVSVRKDCIVLVSPPKSLVLNNDGAQAFGLVNWRNSVHNSSYAVMDTGYKQQYDRYNDIYRWIPLNGDIAGLCARTDNTNDPWWSPAGLNRGQIKNCVKLAYNPRLADRDLLFSNGINPVITSAGGGTVLFGDKTMQSKPSAFDHINVRRLFIVLEKAISTAAKYSLFEFNDAFTRSQFKNLITPYLRNIQGRRGITDFLIICDDTNNTAQVIDSSTFIGDIYIKPARSINFIQLNFKAVGTGVQFSQVVGS